MSRHAAGWLLLVGVSGVTFTLRAFFLVFARSVAALPPRVLEALTLVAPAALAAVVVTAFTRAPLVLSLLPGGLAAGVAAACMARTNRVATSVALGLLAFAILDWFL